MRAQRSGILVGLLLIGQGWCSNPPALADVAVLSSQSAPTSVSAYRDVVGWSEGQVDDQGNVQGYKLVFSIGDMPPVPARAATRAVPFDLDLGPDAKGRAVAVYSRCRRESSDSSFRERVSRLPVYTQGEGCDVYQYDVVTGREVRVRGASKPGRSEVLPTRWRDRIAFAVTGNGTRARRRGAAMVIRSNGREEKVAGGSGSNAGDGPDGPGPVALELYGRSLAYVWDVVGFECRGSEDPSFKFDPVRSEVWVARHGEKQRRFGLGCSTDGTVRFSSPSFAAGRLVFLRSQQTDEVIERRALGGGSRTLVATPPCTRSISPLMGMVAFARLATCPQPATGQQPGYEIGTLTD